MKPFSQRTPAEIYLEYVNDWITVNRMAENYNMNEDELRNIIDKGRMEHEENVAKSKKKYTTEEPRFSFQELDKKVNITDLKKWVENNEMVGIVDEKHGGIVGYIHRGHEEEYYTLLNKTKTD